MKRVHFQVGWRAIFFIRKTKGAPYKGARYVCNWIITCNPARFCIIDTTFIVIVKNAAALALAHDHAVKLLRRHVAWLKLIRVLRSIRTKSA
ncbi:MAG: hypothetical protein DI582_07045 [Azospirillum brasilense]|nr:MAG: hypothetical protein DI582_07045 [Azospirillum brasilense]